MTAHKTLDPTNDPALRSWIDGANDAHADFPIQNIPFGVFRRAGTKEIARCCTAVGGTVIDLSALHEAGLFEGSLIAGQNVFALPTLNEFMAMGRPAWRSARERIIELFLEGSSKVRDHVALRERALVPLARAEMLLPAEIGDYTDFYASVHHATNVGSMFRPDNPLLPNYKHVPIGYHGRASSVVVSGSPVRRPLGQTKADDAAAPSFGPSRLLDHELEVGFFVGPGNRLGEPIDIDAAPDHIFGVCLVNDWSARDIQKWEYQPLGPFLAKNFATTVSPWIVTLDALRPYRLPGPYRAEGDPAPLAYLTPTLKDEAWAIDLTLEVLIASAKMREKGLAPARVSIGSFRDMFWTITQMLTHHASNGCNLRPGDLMASGTVSGTTKESRGCMLERTWRGSEPIALPTGESRKFLEDGDEVVIRGWCENGTARRIGLGECRGVVTPAPTSSR